MSSAKGNKPDWRLSGLDKNSEVKGNIGVAWTKPDGSISIKLNPFVMLNGANDGLVLTLFPNNDERWSSTKAAAATAESTADLFAEPAKKEEIPF